MRHTPNMAAGSAGILLHLTERMLVAGETVRGEVELNHPTLEMNGVEKVFVKLSGSVDTNIVVTQNVPQSHESRPLYHQKVVIWRKGQTVPSHSTRIPFSFKIPQDLPPSFQFDGLYMNGRVGHVLEVIGIRPKSTNHRIVMPLSIVSPDPIGAQHRQGMESGWTGQWVTAKKEAYIRKGIWGAHATVNMELRLPAVATFPLFTRIPFVVSIVTFTKEMKIEELPKASQDNLFPTPPHHAKDISFRLRRHIEVSANSRNLDEVIDYARLGGLGETTAPEGDQLQVLEKQWIPSSDARKGVWRQETLVRSSFTLQASPTFSCPSLKLKYVMSLKVSFPGVGNTVETTFPVEIGSGMTSRPEHRSRRRTTPIEPAPPYEDPDASQDHRRITLDLPPSYWSVAEWDNDGRP